MKDKGVCEGCMYYRMLRDAPMLGMFCDFMEMEGQSRMIVEQNNGGIKHDSCICKTTKKREKKEAGWRWRKW